MEEVDVFDPNCHESLLHVPDPKKDNNSIAFVIQKGYLINGKLLRAQKVALVKNSK